MESDAQLCVIIPVHKPSLTADEQVSLKACKARLHKYDCYLIFPEGMNISSYTLIFENLLLCPVEPSWLSSVENYNKMKLSLNFYKKFTEYKSMLTYELDAYIFDAAIESTNALTFDYIGAPFYEGYWEAKPGAGFMQGCNSGFSIRNIQACIDVLNGMKKYSFRWFLYQIFLSRMRPLRLKLNELTNKKYEVFITGRFGFYFADFHINEDVVWSEIIPQLFPSFKVADPLSALKFSFEYNLEQSLELNGGKLPLGCHAWYKHHDFWKTYIDIES
jgi:hypothetical protein